MENIDQKTLFVAFTPGQAAELTEGRSVFPQEPVKGLVCAPRRRMLLNVPTTFISGILNMWTTVKRRLPRKDLSLPPFV